jgi:threonine-phosphate decarboxylase
MRKVPFTGYDQAILFRHGDAAGRDRAGLLDFSVSVNPLGPPPSVLATLERCCRHTALLGRYPDQRCARLAEYLARRHGVDRDQIVIGNGSNDLIYAAVRAFRPRRVAIMEPTYTEYLRASLRAGAEVDHWLADEPDFDPETFDPQGADLVWVANPNNPTGRLWKSGRLEAWIEAFPRTRFVVDEAFLPFRRDETAHSLIAAVLRLPNLLVLRSLTKLYGMPGLRLGYLVAEESRAAALRDEIVPWSVNTLAQAAGLAALEDWAFLARTHSWFIEQALPFVQRLQSISSALAPIPSEANFVLVRLGGITSGHLVGELAARGIAVRDAANFVGLHDRYVRIAARTSEDNCRLVTALSEVCVDG